MDARCAIARAPAGSCRSPMPARPPPHLAELGPLRLETLAALHAALDSAVERCQENAPQRQRAHKANSNCRVDKGGRFVRLEMLPASPVCLPLAAQSLVSYRSGAERRRRQPGLCQAPYCTSCRKRRCMELRQGACICSGFCGCVYAQGVVFCAQRGCMDLSHARMGLCMAAWVHTL